MRKAEDRALKKYPAERGHMHDRPYQREGFIEGYHQAEKDNELMAHMFEYRDANRDEMKEAIGQMQR